MKAKFTYKEYTLFAGIVVAIIIMLTLWLNPVSAEPSDVSRKLHAPVAKPAAKSAVKNVVLTLRSIIK